MDGAQFHPPWIEESKIGPCNFAQVVQGVWYIACHDMDRADGAAEVDWPGCAFPGGDGHRDMDLRGERLLLEGVSVWPAAGRGGATGCGGHGSGQLQADCHAVCDGDRRQSAEHGRAGSDHVRGLHPSCVGWLLRHAGGRPRADCEEREDAGDDGGRTAGRDAAGPEDGIVSRRDRPGGDSAGVSAAAGHELPRIAGGWEFFGRCWRRRSSASSRGARGCG